MFFIWKQFLDNAKAATKRIDCTSKYYPIFGSNEASTAIILSVIAIEAFLNEVSEVIELESTYLDPNITSLGKALREGERSLSIEDKVKMIFEHSGIDYDISKSPIQDFRLLVNLRNSLVHYKVSKSADGRPIKLLRSLRSKNILLNHPKEFINSPAYSWFHEVSTQPAACWAYKTSLLIILAISHSLGSRLENILTGILAAEEENA